jgi:putative glutamine amidotransferase
MPAGSPPGSPPGPPADAPVIGLTAYSTRARWGIWDAEAVLLPRHYTEAIVRAGGVPVLLPPIPGVIAAAADRLDGLLIAGGPDVDPARYGQERGPDTQPSVGDRDQAELDLLAAAVDDGLPVLGICRGMQLINVARGGSLIQHLPAVLQHDRHAPTVGAYGSHPVSVAPGSRLAALLGRTAVPGVPTYHHQGVAAIGAGLVATAWADDGTVEAVEDPSLPFCVAVQWHPEEGDDDALFHALVAAAHRARARRAATV